MRPEYTPAFLARFWAKVDKNGPIPANCPELGQCWLWTGAKHSAEYPYGEVGVKGRPRGTHRVALDMAGCTLFSGDVARHVCDNPACVRNDTVGTYIIGGIVVPRFGHLYPGTHSLNAWDKVAKGRAPVGDSHPNRQRPERLRWKDTHAYRLDPDRLARKIPFAERAVIVARHKAGGITQKALAAEYGVTPTCIYLIIKAAHHS